MTALIPAPRASSKVAADLAQAEQFYRRLVTRHPRHVEGWFQLGLIAIRQDRYQAAAEALATVTALDPTHLAARQHLAAAYQALGKPADAANEYAEMIRQRPACAEAQNDLGVALVRQGRHEEAAVAFAAAARLKPDFAEAYNNWGNVLVEQRDYRAALDHFRRALELRPEYAEAHHNLGYALARLGRKEEATVSFAQAVRWRADYAEAHFRLANLQRDLGRFDDAISAYRAALRYRPQHGEARTQLALTLAHLDRYDEAAACLHQGLLFEPQSAETFNNLGVVLAELRRNDEAAAAFRQALRLRPGFAAAANNLASVLPDDDGKRIDAPQDADARNRDALTLAQQGKLEDAAAYLHRGLLYQPHSPDTYNNLGVVLAQLERHDEAAAAFAQALRLRPDFPEALNNRGHTLLRGQQVDESIACFRRALELRPAYAQAYHNLGTALVEQGRTADATAAFCEAVRLQPDYAEAHLALAGVYQRAGRLEEAVASCRQVLELRPGLPAALLNLGIALAQLGRFAEAEAAYTDVLARQPDSADAHNSLGVTRLHQDRHEDALASFNEAIRLKPDAAEMRMNRAMTLLALGELKRGWGEYESRWQQKHSLPRPFPQPLWDGTPMLGGTVLLHAEQGMGDTVQFIRYAALVKPRVATVIAEVPGPLKNLIASCPGVDAVVEAGAPLPPFDAHTPLLSLPRLFGTTLENIPAVVPYLFTDVALRQRWQKELWECAQFTVGIVWQGNPRYGGDRYRSVPLAMFRPLAEVPGVRLVSLQKGHGAEQIAALGAAFPIADVGCALSADFRDAAALIENLDLVIAVDTTIAHLAGALAAPVWLLLPFHADWRWLRGCEDSLWYPTMRLFRQRRWGDWQETIEHIAAEIDNEIRSSATRTRRQIEEAMCAARQAGTLEREAASLVCAWLDAQKPHTGHASRSDATA